MTPYGACCIINILTAQHTLLSHKRRVKRSEPLQTDMALFTRNVLLLMLLLFFLTMSDAKVHVSITNDLDVVFGGKNSSLTLHCNPKTMISVFMISLSLAPMNLASCRIFGGPRNSFAVWSLKVHLTILIYTFTKKTENFVKFVCGV